MLEKDCINEIEVILNQGDRPANSWNSEALDRERRIQAVITRYHGATKRNLPVFTHDCSRCVFLGSITLLVPQADKSTIHTAFDLYACPTSSALGASIIARHGNEGSEYASMPSSLIHSLRQAVKEHGHSGYSQALLEGYSRYYPV